MPIFQSGETFEVNGELCDICECVNGEVMCQPRCEIPVCTSVGTRFFFLKLPSSLFTY